MSWIAVAALFAKNLVYMLAALAVSVAFVCLVWKHLVHPRDPDDPDNGN